jgi:tripartite-type tricarboxylate transporter receptor subunit TctC
MSMRGAAALGVLVVSLLIGCGQSAGGGGGGDLKGKTIDFVVPYEPGGGYDAYARLSAEPNVLVVAGKSRFRTFDDILAGKDPVRFVATGPGSNEYINSSILPKDPAQGGYDMVARAMARSTSTRPAAR